MVDIERTPDTNWEEAAWHLPNVDADEQTHAFHRREAEIERLLLRPEVHFTDMQRGRGVQAPAGGAVDDVDAVPPQTPIQGPSLSTARDWEVVSEGNLHMTKNGLVSTSGTDRSPRIGREAYSVLNRFDSIMQRVLVLLSSEDLFADVVLHKRRDYEAELEDCANLDNQVSAKRQKKPSTKPHTCLFTNLMSKLSWVEAVKSPELQHSVVANTVEEVYRNLLADVDATVGAQYEGRVHDTPISSGILKAVLHKLGLSILRQLVRETCVRRQMQCVGLALGIWVIFASCGVLNLSAGISVLSGFVIITVFSVQAHWASLERYWLLGANLRTLSSVGLHRYWYEVHV